MRRMTGGSVAEMVSYAVADDNISDTELAELESLIEEWKDSLRREEVAFHRLSHYLHEHPSCKRRFSFGLENKT